MPWKETCAMNERMKFVVDYEQRKVPLAVLCRQYGISRVTGYKWLKRYEVEGVEGLQDRSRAAKHHPQAVPERLENAIVELRHQHRWWGPRKIRVYLQQHRPHEKWPAISTMGEILKRHGLTVPRKRQRRGSPSPSPLTPSSGPNTVWCADFKGWFLTGDGRRCDPLTLVDQHSRYLLRCQLLPKTGLAWTQPLLEAAFAEYGLPEVIRTDNGAPFASHGIAGLSKLSVWWLRLGIMPERIEPGHPQQNGVQERLHLTLKQETASPPRASWRAQQRSLDRFRQEYNEQRPHESLQDQVPASRYELSPRPYPERLPQTEYPETMLVRRVQKTGEFYWKHRKVFLGEAFARQVIGVEPLDDRYYQVYFTQLPLGIFDSHTLKMLSRAQHRKVLQRFDKESSTVSSASAPETVEEG